MDTLIPATHDPQDLPAPATKSGKLSDAEFLEKFGVPKGPAPVTLRQRKKKGHRVLHVSHQTSMRVLTARMERLALATKKVPRTRLNPTVKQARELEDWPMWMRAIHAELQMLKEMGCYDVVRLEDVQINPKTGRKYQIIPTKMDLRLKHDALGHPTKYKGRLVVLGNQEWGDTLRDVFAPTVNSRTINLVLALAAQQGLHLYGLDIFGAFITAEIDEPVYVQLPKGLDPVDPEAHPIWKLNRTLYGLKRAPKAFYDQLRLPLVAGLPAIHQRPMPNVQGQPRWLPHLLLHLR
jgi:hypothetical protein